MKQVPEKLKNSAPEATTWFGGPMDRSKVSLRIFGDELNPEKISRQLNCKPSISWKRGDTIKGTIIARTGRWSLESNLSDESDLEDKIWELLNKVSTDAEVWDSISQKNSVDLFCGVFLETGNRGFGISSRLMKELSRLCIDIGFDIYAP